MLHGGMVGERTMNAGKETDYIFNFTLSKYVGLYQVLHPNTTKLCGYNVYHIVIVFFGLMVLSVAMLFPVGLYYLMNDITAFILYIGCIDNVVFSCCKMINILYYIKDIWRCIDVTSFGFMTYKHYDVKIFEKWRRLCVQVTYVCSSLTFFALLCWDSSPLIFNKSKIRIRNLDGSYSTYPLNVFNLYVMASEETYAEHFYVYLLMEMTIGICFTYFTVIFDIFVITMCFALACQLETVCDAIHSLGYRHPIVDDHSGTNNLTESERKRRVNDDLKQILSDHKNVIMKMNDYYKIVRTITLSQIFVASSSHVFIWFIAAMSFDESSTRDSILSIKLFIVLPVFTFQLYVTCILFGTINEKKDAIIFALYSSNWMDMNIESRKLIVCAMHLNNANQVKLKFTETKIVNLEMFSNTMRLCYSIFSMMINKNKQK